MKLKSPIPIYKKTVSSFTRKISFQTSQEQTLISGEPVEQKLECEGMRRIFYFPAEIASRKMYTGGCALDKIIVEGTRREKEGQKWVKPASNNSFASVQWFGCSMHEIWFRKICATKGIENGEVLNINWKMCLKLQSSSVRVCKLDESYEFMWITTFHFATK